MNPFFRNGDAAVYYGNPVTFRAYTGFTNEMATIEFATGYRQVVPASELCRPARAPGAWVPVVHQGGLANA